MKYLQNKLQLVYMKVSTKQVIVLTIVYILFLSFALPFVAVQTSKLIGVSESPDTSFNFNVNHIISIVDSYGKEGRMYYVIIRWTFDIVWPIIYTLFLGSTIAYLARRTKFRFDYKVLYFVFLSVSFDLLENINSTIIMLFYPKDTTFFVYLLLISSLLKWTFIGISFILLLWLFIRFIIKSFKKNLSN